MSKKSSRPPVKVSLPSPPRDLAAIQAEYSQAATQAGQVQYQLFVFEEELSQINEKLLSLNKEGAARNELDRKQKEKEGAADEQA